MSDPEAPPQIGPSVEQQAQGQAAQVRPHPHHLEPAAVDPQWWDRLYREMDIESLLSAAMACHRSRSYWDQPGWPDIYRRLLLTQAELFDAIDQHKDSHVLRELYRQVTFAIKGRH